MHNTVVRVDVDVPRCCRRGALVRSCVLKVYMAISLVIPTKPRAASANGPADAHTEAQAHVRE